MKRLLLLLICICTMGQIKATINDNLQISLLTVEPRSNEVYTVYGHTALRVYDHTRGIDVVYNWGTFNFDAPFFLYHFVKGETDYFLSDVPYEYFHYAYLKGNSTVREQILAIPNESKQAFIDALALNLQPENQEYRYDFLFDNCSTRPRDLIEKYCGGKLVYPEQTEKVTFRDLIHSCTDPYPWMTFGLDLIIGSGADSLVSKRQELFLPVRLMDALNQAVVITENGETRPIVASFETIILSAEENTSQQDFWTSPLIVSIIILILFGILLIIELVKKRKFRIPYIIIFLIAGIGGCIVAFVTLLSYHPCTDANWNLLWLHPFHFIGLIGLFLKKSYSLIRWYHWSNFVLLPLFIILSCFWGIQHINSACVPFTLCLLLCSKSVLTKGTNRV